MCCPGHVRSGLSGGVFFDPFGPPRTASVLELSETHIDLGTVSYLDTCESAVSITNKSADRIRFRFLNDCDCTHLTPASGELAAGETLPVRLLYRPKGKGLQSVEAERSSVELAAECNGHWYRLPLTVSCVVIRPIVVNKAELALTCDALATCPFEINLSLESNVEKLTLEEFPSFVEWARCEEVDARFSAWRVVGSIHRDVAETLRGSLKIRAWLSPGSAAVDSLNVGLPIVCEARRPFQLSQSHLSVRQNEVQVVSIVPSPHIASLDVVDITCEGTGVSAEVMPGNALRVSAGEELSDFSYVNLIVECIASDQKKGQFSQHILVSRNPVPQNPLPR